ncbi:MAG: DUF368 domain-containing protein [Anaerolineae bacterium]
MDQAQAPSVSTPAAQTSGRNRSLIDYFWVTARGFCMGAADVVPGVSGGTIAFILGIYDELINAIHAVNLRFVRRLIGLRWREAFGEFPWQFLLALGMGIGLAIVILSRPLSHALQTSPSLVWAFFFGLVLASVLVVRKRVRRWTPATVALALVAAVGAYILVGLTPTETPNDAWFLFLSGAIAICAMILPGISGSFILVLLGKYQYVLGAVTHADVITLAIFVAGAAAGIVTFVRVLRWVLRRYHDPTVAVLAGFMLGSLRKVWPWKDAVDGQANVLPQALTPEVGLALALVVAGAALVIAIDLVAARQHATAPAGKV